MCSQNALLLNVYIYLVISCAETASAILQDHFRKAGNAFFIFIYLFISEINLLAQYKRALSLLWLILWRG